LLKSVWPCGALNFTILGSASSCAPLINFRAHSERLRDSKQSKAEHPRNQIQSEAGMGYWPKGNWDSEICPPATLWSVS